MSEKIYKSFEEFFHDEKETGWFNCDEETPDHHVKAFAKQFWKARDAEINELKKQIEEMKRCENCKYNDYISGCELDCKKYSAWELS